MARYSDINRAEELRAAYQEMQQWRAKTREQKRTAFDAVNKADSERMSVNKVTRYIKPFGQPGGNLILVGRVPDSQRGTAGAALITAIKALVDGRVSSADPAAGDTVLKVQGYGLAKVTITERNGTADKAAKSRITGLPYTRQHTNSLSSPFGKASSAETYQEAVTAILAKGQADPYKNHVDGRSIRFTPENGKLI